MAVPIRKPALPTVSLYLGVASAALIPFGFVIGTIGNIASIASITWRAASLIGIGIAGLAWLLSPACAIAAIITGQLSRRRYPSEAFGKAGLIIGICALGLFVLLLAVSVTTWLLISTAGVSRH